MRNVPGCSNISAAANICCQHMLLWSSLYVLVSGFYMLLTLGLDREDMAATIAAVVAVGKIFSSKRHALLTTLRPGSRIDRLHRASHYCGLLINKVV